MSVNNKSPREHIAEFVELYRNCPCLWNVTHQDYSDRNKIDLAYIELVKKYKELDPSADRNIVVNKINSLRTVYKRELAKMDYHMEYGSGAEEVYKPSLWYVTLLQFLDDQDILRPPRRTMNRVEVKEEPADMGVMNVDVCMDETTTADNQGLELPATTVETSKTISRPSIVRKRQLNDIEDATADVLHLVGKKLETIKPDDPHDIFGKHVADRLRKINPNQIKFAQKLIGDILFEADMEALNRNCKIVGTVDP